MPGPRRDARRGRILRPSFRFREIVGQTLVAALPGARAERPHIEGLPALAQPLCPVDCLSCPWARGPGNPPGAAVGKYALGQPDSTAPLPMPAT